MQTIDVALAERSYPIFIGEGLLPVAASLLGQHIHARQVMLVSNPVVSALYALPLQRSLEAAGFVVDSVTLPDGEAFKTLETVNRVFDALLERRHSRDTTLVALGGGVIGDMTGFAAACYQRGVDFIQVPTTLLSQVDSSVGGKTGVNHPAGKNMIGAFHQPRAVLIDVATLDTLPDRELSAGLAEVIKYALIADAPFLAWLEAHADALLRRDRAALVEAVSRSCATKARIVAADEREQDVRAILNLGHTFGHAIEAFLGYGEWLHGEAVAAGMVLAARLSARLGWLDEAGVGRVVALLQQVRLPVAPPPAMVADDFLRYMAVDKKVKDGRIRLVLLRGIGDALVTDAVSAQHIRDFLAG